MRAYLTKIASGQVLSEPEAESAMSRLLTGEATDIEIAAFLLGLRSRGEHVDEMVGFTRAMRQHAIQVTLDDPNAIDLCGTGGDGSGTFNISTAASLVCAGAGITVAKHGNRSVSSKCGSADVLEALGVRTALAKAGVEYCLNEAGIAFLFAPYFHPAMKTVMPVRRALGVRTFFNILGPLCNPAGVRRQLVGAFSTNVARQMAEVLGRLGADHAIALSSSDGLDEISLSSDTTLFEVRSDGGKSGRHRQYSISPEQLGFQRQQLDGIRGGDAQTNASIISGILDGQQGPARDVTVINAAHALLTSGRFKDVRVCVAAAQESIDSGSARARLERLAVASQQAPRDA